MDNVLPLDPTQDLIFPPELLVSKPCVLVVANRKVNISGHYFFILFFYLHFIPSFQQIMGKKKAERLCFQGEKVRWISPADLKDLIKLKAEYPNAPLLVGNTTIAWFQEKVHPSIHPFVHPNCFCSFTGPKMNLKGTVHPLVLYGGSIPELRTIKWRKNGKSWKNHHCICLVSEY